MKITLLHYKIGLGFLNSKYLITSFYFREFSKEKEKAQSRGDFQRLRAQQQLEEDLQVDTNPSLCIGVSLYGIQAATQTHCLS